MSIFIAYILITRFYSGIKEGYNPDLLEQGKPSPRPSPRAGALTPSLPPGATYGGSSEENYNKSAVLAPPPTKTRSRKLWWIIGVAVFLVVVAVAVGAGVGVSQSKNNGESAPESSISNPTSEDVQGVSTGEENVLTTKSLSQDPNDVKTESSTAVAPGAGGGGGGIADDSSSQEPTASLESTDPKLP